MSQHPSLVYLAGPITGHDYDSLIDWRERWISDLYGEGITCLSPLRGKNYLQGKGAVQNSYDAPLCTDRGIISRDHFDCCRADAIIINVKGFNTPSLGTCMEAAWGYHSHTPMVWIIEEEGNPHDHPMLRQCMDFRTSGEEEAQQILRSILNPMVGHKGRGDWPLFS